MDFSSGQRRKRKKTVTCSFILLLDITSKHPQSTCFLFPLYGPPLHDQIDDQNSTALPSPYEQRASNVTPVGFNAQLRERLCWRLIDPQLPHFGQLLFLWVSITAFLALSGKASSELPRMDAPYSPHWRSEKDWCRLSRDFAFETPACMDACKCQWICGERPAS